MPKKSRVRFIPDKKKVMSYRFGTDKLIVNSDYEYFTIETIARNYLNAIDSDRERINSKLNPFYGRALNIPEQELGNVIDKIIKIEEKTGKKMEEIAIEIREYLGNDCSFFRTEGDKLIPIESDRLLQAYKYLKARFPIKLIKSVLYN